MNKIKLINNSAIRKIVDLDVAKEVEEELNKITIELLKKAEHRAKQNFRKTILKRDL